MGVLAPIYFRPVGTVLAVSLRNVPAVHAYAQKATYASVCWVICFPRISCNRLIASNKARCLEFAGMQGLGAPIYKGQSGAFGSLPSRNSGMTCLPNISMDFMTVLWSTVSVAIRNWSSSTPVA